MEMLLMGACLSIFGLAVACLTFGAATRDARKSEAAATAAEQEVFTPATAPARFFAETPARPRVPLEALLLQIENHVRLEQAAAECFMEAPNASRLHSRTTSALVN